MNQLREETASKVLDMIKDEAPGHSLGKSSKDFRQLCRDTSMDGEVGLQRVRKRVTLHPSIDQGNATFLPSQLQVFQRGKSYVGSPGVVSAHCLLSSARRIEKCTQETRSSIFMLRLKHDLEA
jgi:hypothetical protein